VSSPQALLLSGQVLEVLADQDLERIAGMAAAGFRCTSCGRRGGPGDGPASVVIVVRPQRGSAARAAVVSLAHAWCSPLRVIEENDAPPAPAWRRPRPAAVSRRAEGPAGDRAARSTGRGSGPR
jgi:hypothetical protein